MASIQQLQELKNLFTELVDVSESIKTLCKSRNDKNGNANLAGSAYVDYSMSNDNSQVQNSVDNDTNDNLPTDDYLVTNRSISYIYNDTNSYANVDDLVANKSKGNVLNVAMANRSENSKVQNSVNNDTNDNLPTDDYLVTNRSISYIYNDTNGYANVDDSIANKSKGNVLNVAMVNRSENSKKLQNHDKNFECDDYLVSNKASYNFSNDDIFSRSEEIYDFNTGSMQSTNQLQTMGVELPNNLSFMEGYKELLQEQWNDTTNLIKTPNNITWTQDVLNEMLPQENDDIILTLSPIINAMGLTTVNQVMQQQSPQVSLDSAINMNKTTQTSELQIMHNACTMSLSLSTPEKNVEMFQEEMDMDFDKNENNQLVAIHEQPVLPQAPEGRKQSESQNDFFQEARKVKLHISLNIRPKNKTGCDISNMIVKTSDNTAKKLCCPFCNKLYSKLARHIESIHATEVDVQTLLSFEKGSKERREIQDLLRKAGTFIWNTNDELNDGVLITSRRPDQKLNKKATDYDACPYCLGEFANLRHHISNHCQQRPAVNKALFKGERVMKVLSKTVEARYSEKANKGLSEMFNSMQDDDIVRLVKFDWLLIEFGNRICLKYNAQKDKGNKSNQLRTAGRILSTMKSINSKVRDFASIYQTDLFDLVIDVIKIMSVFNPSTNEFKTPGLASTCVALIKRIGVILRSQYIRKKDAVKKIDTEEFLILTDTDMPYVISKAITDTKSRMRRERTVNLPSPEDIYRLAQYIGVKRNAVFEELKKQFFYGNWVKLSELTLASVLVFNRRRVGETQQIKVKNFMSRESFDEESNAQLFTALSEESKLVAKEYTRMQVRGKKDRTVPVLLNRNVEACIQVLLDNRENAGISIDNEWLFALPSSIKTNLRFVNGWTVLSTLRKSCGAINPSSLTGTNLRKQLATFCVTLELNDGLVSEVADFMGHADEVHRGWYRNNTVDRQVVTMSKILEAAQGNTADNKTKTDEGSTSPVGVIQSHARKVVHKRKIKSQPANEGTPVPKRKKQSENCMEAIELVPKRNKKSQPSNECESKPVLKRKTQSQPKTRKVIPKRNVKTCTKKMD